MASRKKTATVLQLVPALTPSSSAVVDALTSALEKAKRGEIAGIALAFHLRGEPGGTVSHVRALEPDASFAVVVAALEWAKFDLIRDANALWEREIER